MKTSMAIVAVFAWAMPASAGLHYSGESVNALPAKWRGFLTDHRALRLLAVPKAASPFAESYNLALNKLEGAARTRPLTADEMADLGAILVRIGKPDKAVELLRPAAREHSRHFRLAANLGTAWQLAGDLKQAELVLADAIELAPANLRDAETAHLKLVRLRRKEGKVPADAPDALFEKAPDAAIVQRLALWLPADGRLLWQLAVIAHDAGDLRTAAAMLDGCVVEFGMKSERLRKQRLAWRAAVDEQDRRGHELADRGTLFFPSARALARTFDESRLPTINPTGATEMPWPALAETTLGKAFKPKYLKFVDALDGKSVSIVGYVRPTTADTELTAFLFTEFPIGCWFCELPEPTGMVAVVLAEGNSTDARKTPVKVTGIFRLNRTDPEAYLFSIENARVGAAD